MGQWFFQKLAVAGLIAATHAETELFTGDTSLSPTTEMSIEVYDLKIRHPEQCENPHCYRMAISIDGQPVAHWITSPGREQHLKGYFTPEWTARPLVPPTYPIFRNQMGKEFSNLVFAKDSGIAIYGSDEIPENGLQQTGGSLVLSQANALQLKFWIDRAFANGVTPTLTTEDTMPGRRPSR